MKASVVIPTYRRRDSVGRALGALARQCLANDGFEVIVVPNGPDDGTAAMAQAFRAPFDLRVVRREQPGRAGACNAGVAAAAGEVIILLDDDMEPSPGFVAAHCRAHGGRRVGVVGAAPVVVDASSSAAAGYIAARFERHLATLAVPGYRFKLRDFYSGNFSIRRDDLVRAGGFDESFTEYGNEDLELSRRLVQSGVALVFSPEALAHQHYEKDFAGLARDTMAKGRTAVLFARKHPEVLPELKLSGYRDASWRHRLARGTLLRLARAWGGAPNAVIAAVQRLERRRPARLHKVYSTALDYFYWLGATAAQREGKENQ